MRTLAFVIGVWSVIDVVCAIAWRRAMRPNRQWLRQERSVPQSPRGQPSVAFQSHINGHTVLTRGWGVTLHKVAVAHGATVAWVRTQHETKALT